MMIREAVRIVFKMEGERAINNLKLYLEEWKDIDIAEARPLIRRDLQFHIAEVLVALTKEEVGVEYARGNAIKNATKFVNTVKTTLHRKVGKYDNLLITLSDDKVHDKDSFVSSIDSFVKLLSSSDFTLDNFINKGSLIVALLLHVSGFSEIDIHVSVDVDTYLQ